MRCSDSFGACDAFDSMVDEECCCDRDSDQHIGRDTMRIAIRNGSDSGS
jgi:hypothetical protein